MLKIGDEKYKIEESKEYYLKNLQCVKLENVVDSISYASQLGRLDVVSLLLALFGIIFGFGAIFGFLYIKERSEFVAHTAAESWLKVNSKKLIEDVKKEEKEGEMKHSEWLQKAKQEARKQGSSKEQYEEL